MPRFGFGPHAGSRWRPAGGGGGGGGAPNATLTATTLTIGDSWYGNASPPYPGFYMGYYFAGHPERTLVNMGLGGQGLGYLRSRVADIVAQKPYVLCVSFGRNDFMNSDLYGNQSPDAAVVFAAYVAYYRSCIDDIKAGCPGIAIAVETITERHASDGGADGSGGYNDKFNAKRAQLNAAIKGWETSGVIARAIDIGGEATIGAAGAMRPGSAMSADGLHLTEAASGPATAGHANAYPVFAAAMNALYAATPIPSEDLVSTFSIAPFSPSSQIEGNTGATVFTTTVTRAGALARAASVQWAVTGTGASPADAADFVGGALPSGTLAFAANETAKTISVPVQGDAVYEPDEDFVVTLGNPLVAGALGTATTAGRILNDDDPAAAVSITALASQETGNFPGSVVSFNGVTVPAGKTYLNIFSDYGAPIGGVILRRTGQADVALAATGYLWAGDVAVAASDYSLVISCASGGFVKIVVGGVVLTGAAAAPAVQEQKGFQQGVELSWTGSTSLTAQPNGATIKTTVYTSAGTVTDITSPDGAATLVKKQFTNYNGRTCWLLFDRITSTAAFSYSPTGASGEAMGDAMYVDARAFAKA